MIVNSDAILGRANAGRPIGYSVLTIAREPFAEFTRGNVLETSPGRFCVVGGVNVPMSGAFVVWGLPDKPIAEDVIQPAPLEMMGDFQRRIFDQFNSAVARFIRAVPTPVVQMETSHFDGTLAKLRQEFAAVAQRQQTQVAELEGHVSEATQHMRALDSIAEAMRDLSTVAERVDVLFGEQSLAAQMFRSSGSQHHIAEALDVFRREIVSFRGEMDSLTRAVHNERPVSEALRQILPAIDQFIEMYGGTSDESGTI